MMNQLFNFSIELRIDWSDLDLFGHVNNVAIFKYIQASRVNIWEQIGLNKMHKENNQGPILASSACNFKKPLFFPGQIKILAQIVYIKNTSFSISHQIYNQNEEMVADAIDILVMYDFNTNKKMSFPEAIKNTIQKL